MRGGDIVLAYLPQADQKLKKRPALLLTKLPPFGDFLVCGISSQLRHEAAGFDEILDEQSPDFIISSLKKPSLIRLSYLVTVPMVQIGGKIGRIGDERFNRLLRRLSDFLIAQPH